MPSNMLVYSGYTYMNHLWIYIIIFNKQYIIYTITYLLIDSICFLLLRPHNFVLNILYLSKFPLLAQVHSRCLCIAQFLLGRTGKWRAQPQPMLCLLPCWSGNILCSVRSMLTSEPCASASDSALFQCEWFYVVYNAIVADVLLSRNGTRV